MFERAHSMGVRPVRVGISGSYGGLNLGDEAILEVIVRQLRASVPAAVTVFTRDVEDTLRRHDIDHAVPIRELTREEARAEVEKLDLQHSHAVVARMQYAQRTRVLKGEYSAPQLLTLMGHFQFCVGMRLHFLIFAAIQHVPFVALPYASKVEGFLQEMEVPMPPLKDVTTGGLIAHIDRALDIQGQWRGVYGLRDLIRQATEAGELHLPREDMLFFGTPHEHEVTINSTRVR